MIARNSCEAPTDSKRAQVPELKVPTLLLATPVPVYDPSPSVAPRIRPISSIEPVVKYQTAAKAPVKGCAIGPCVAASVPAEARVPEGEETPEP